MLSHLQGHSLTRESSPFVLVIFSIHLQGYSLTRESLRDSLMSFDSLIVAEVVDMKVAGEVVSCFVLFQTEMILLNTKKFACGATV